MWFARFRWRVHQNSQRKIVHQRHCACFSVEKGQLHRQTQEDQDRPKHWGGSANVVFPSTHMAASICFTRRGNTDVAWTVTTLSRNLPHKSPQDTTIGGNGMLGSLLIYAKFGTPALPLRKDTLPPSMPYTSESKFFDIHFPFRLNSQSIALRQFPWKSTFAKYVYNVCSYFLFFSIFVGKKCWWLFISNNSRSTTYGGY